MDALTVFMFHLFVTCFSIAFVFVLLKSICRTILYVVTYDGVGYLVHMLFLFCHISLRHNVHYSALGTLQFSCDIVVSGIKTLAVSFEYTSFSASPSYFRLQQLCLSSLKV